MKKLLSSLSAKVLTVMGAITVILGFLTIDQINNPPIFSTDASTVVTDAGQQAIEIELHAPSEFPLREGQISFFLADEEGTRITLSDSEAGHRDPFVPVNMLIGANASKFGLVAQDQLDAANLDDIKYIYVCATFKGRIFATFHQQSYLLTKTENGYFQLASDTSTAIFRRPKCTQIDKVGVDLPNLSPPLQFD